MTPIAMAPRSTRVLLPFRFPTTVVHVEDQSTFSHTLKWLLAPDIMLLPFTHPDPALGLIGSQRTLRDTCARLAHAPLRDGLPPLLDSEHRFDLISVCVIDYRLVGRDGLSMCRELADQGIERVMLSGQVSLERAREAVVGGEVAAYIDKARADFYADLVAAIQETQAAFFRRIARETLPAAQLKAFFETVQLPVAEAVLDFAYEAPTEMYWNPELPGMTFVHHTGALEHIVILPMDRYARMIDDAATQGADSWYLERLRTCAAAAWTAAATLFNAAEPPEPDDLVPCRVVSASTGNYLVSRLPETSRSEHRKFVCYDQWLHATTAISEGMT